LGEAEEPALLERTWARWELAANPDRAQVRSNRRDGSSPRPWSRPGVLLRARWGL